MSPSNEPTNIAIANTQTVTAHDPDPTTPAVPPQKSLARAVWERRDEYTGPQKIRIKIGSWNVAACNGVEKDLKSWFVQGKGVSERLADIHLDGESKDASNEVEEDDGKTESVVAQERRQPTDSLTVPLGDLGSLPADEDISLYVLGLQEVLDISSAVGALRPYNDPSIAQKWKAACANALPDGYQIVAEQQLSGMLLLIYASPDIAPTVTSVSTTSVGTGIMGYMGNKGGTIARMVLGGSTRIVFVNSHLAAGTEESDLGRRNWGASQIIQRTRFDPIDHGNGVIDEVGETIGEEDFAFWFGDLNYRLSTMAGEDVRRLLMLHTRNEYDEENTSLRLIDKELSATKASRSSLDSGSTTRTDPSSDRTSEITQSEDELHPDDDPASLQTTISSLMPHDQLQEQIRQHKAFHEGWQEGQIRFLPTYKYDIGSVGVFDSSEKKRAPSWCDRILYRTRRDYLAYKQKEKQEADARKRDGEMQARGLDQADEVIFDYDPETDGADEYDEADDANDTEEFRDNNESAEERIRLEYYTSHQRVLSSDHKPLDAIFELTYDAIDRQLKAKVQAEIAREMDKDENESRPQVTLVVDHAEVKDGSSEGLDYGEVKYDVPKTHNITVANTGRVPATVGFVEDLAKEMHPQWLHASFDGKELTPETVASKQHVIEPGETLIIGLTIHVKDPSDVRALNTKTALLEDVRVLRVQGGRDHFITLRGIWLNSCFGLSLEELVRVPEAGVRTCNIDSSILSQEMKWSAPRELFRLTEALEEILERAIAEWDMMKPGVNPPWAAIGWPFLESTYTIPPGNLRSITGDIREALDTNAPFPYPPDFPPPHKVEALGKTLLQFLGSLDGGVINNDLWTAIMTALAERDRAKRPSDPESTRALILETISSSPSRSVAFTFITFMLARIAGEVAPVHDVKNPGLSSKSGNMADGLLGMVRGSGEDPKVTKRKEVERVFADVFEKVVFRVDGDVKKEKKSAEDHRAILTVFLHGKWGDN